MSASVAFAHWSDPLCIWALAAQPRLDGLIDALGDQIDVDYHCICVFGSIKDRFEHGPWAAKGVAGRVAATRDIARKFGRDDISGECWNKVMPASSWAPAQAIKAVFTVDKENGTSIGPEYQRKLRERFFVHERDIAQREVQLELAEELAIPREALEVEIDSGRALARVCEDQAEKDRLHLQGSPTYVFDGGRAVLYGNFAPGILRATVEELLRGSEVGGSKC